MGSFDSISTTPVTTGAQGVLVTALSAHISPTTRGNQFALALYTDDGGDPGTWVIHSGSITVTGAGRLE